jgi:hypothetical protein
MFGIHERASPTDPKLQHLHDMGGGGRTE